MSIPCALAGRCSGCKWIGRPWAEQEAEKAQTLAAWWAAAGLAPITPPPVREIAQAGLRDRVDLTLRREASGLALGLWDLAGGPLLDVPTCPQMSPALAALLGDFRADLPDIDLGSVRLRVGPDGARGVWLDLPNETTQRLIEEQTWIRRLADRVWVEVGQRRKPLEEVDGRFKLRRQPELKPWFRTFLRDHPDAPERPQDLYLTLGDFTQVGVEANRVLVGEVARLAWEMKTDRWLELGAGSGNFTLPLAAQGALVTAVEVEPRALAGLGRAAAEAGLSDRIFPRAASFHRADPALTALFSEHRAVLADPPRSGLGAALDALGAVPEAQRPAVFLYVSCFGESLVADAVRLHALGYHPGGVLGVDLYPQSPHCEWVAVFRR